MVRISRAVALGATTSFALAQAPFPIVTASVNAAQLTKGGSQASSFLAAESSAPAYTSLEEYMATATSLTPAESAAFDYANFDPVALGIEYFQATATPSWLTQIPEALQTFVVDVAEGANSVATQILGETASSSAGGAQSTITGAPTTLKSTASGAGSPTSSAASSSSSGAAAAQGPPDNLLVGSLAGSMFLGMLLL